MKRIIAVLLALSISLLWGCSAPSKAAQVVATTLPVYEFTAAICENTDITVTRLITESVSCLHDYTLQVTQAKALEQAQLIVINGAGLEDFLTDVIAPDKPVINATGILVDCEEEGHDHDHEHDHAVDPHLWLSVTKDRLMAENIYNGLVAQFPEKEAAFTANYEALAQKFDALAAYAEAQLSGITKRNILTFHDGFSYLAADFGINIVHAIEEESGSEASAKELIEMVQLVQTHQVGAIFTEINGSVSAAGIISSETGVPVYALDMAMGGDSYFDAMYYNIDILKEALQ